MDLDQFIATYIHSVDELRALLLLQAEPAFAGDASEIGGRLRLPLPVIEAALANLATRALLARNPEGKFHYHPATAGLADLVAQLAEMDRVQPVTLINRIYARSSPLQAFADAFRLKRDREK